MNEVLKAIKERRSIRKFKQTPVPKKLLEQIVEAGLYAPSGMNKQSTKIVVITNKEMIQKFSKLNHTFLKNTEDFDPFFGSPAVLLVMGEKGHRNTAFDGAVVMENMMLAAHSLGLGSIWVNRAREELNCQEGLQLLKEMGIIGEYEGIGHCLVGYIDGDIPQAAPRKDDRVYWID